MERLLVVAFGGAMGAVLRYTVARWSLETFGNAFPWGTWAVNLLGSALLAYLAAASTAPELWLERHPAVRVMLTVGFLGALTTYSTFNLELLRYFEQGRWRLGLLYGLATSVGCLLAAVGGASLARISSS